MPERSTLHIVVPKTTQQEIDQPPVVGQRIKATSDSPNMQAFRTGRAVIATVNTELPTKKEQPTKSDS